MNSLSIVIIVTLLVELNSNWAANTNCLLHKDKKLFVLIDLKGEEAYQVHTVDGQQIYFNFCEPFSLYQCDYKEKYLAYHIKSINRTCTPLTSKDSGKFNIEYSFESEISQNVLSITYLKDIKQGYYLTFKLVCSDEEFNIKKAYRQNQQVIVIAQSIHGCPIYESPAIIDIIQEYEILIAIFLLITGFFFLFYGRVMIDITSFSSSLCLMVIYLSFLSFKFLEQKVQQTYLYITLVIILVVSVAVSFLMKKFFVKASLFFIGALFGFIIGTFIKAFLLAYLSKNTSLLYLFDGLLNFLIVALMLIYGSFTLEKKEQIIIYSTSVIGSYFIIRAFSFAIGGFPSEYQLYELVVSKKISKIPVSFYIYLLLIILLATVGAIYQEIKLQKQQNSREGTQRSSVMRTQRSSFLRRSVSTYLEPSLDRIHDRIELIINRYQRDSIIGNPVQNNSQQIVTELAPYSKMQDEQK